MYVCKAFFNQIEKLQCLKVSASILNNPGVITALNPLTSLLYCRDTGHEGSDPQLSGKEGGGL